MLPNTPPTYVGTKRRTGPVDFHVNKMRALNLSAKYMKKVEDDLRGLPGSFNDLSMTPLMKIGEMAGSNVFDQVNKSTANALKKQRMRKMAQYLLYFPSLSACPRLSPRERRAFRK